MLSAPTYTATICGGHCVKHHMDVSRHDFLRFLYAECRDAINYAMLVRRSDDV